MALYRFLFAPALLVAALAFGHAGESTPRRAAPSAEAVHAVPAAPPADAPLPSASGGAAAPAATAR
jgi:hypothetical protein